MSTYFPTSVIYLGTNSHISSGHPYAVANGAGYTRDWVRYFDSQAIAYGQARITGIDNGPGTNQYSVTLLVTTWPPGSLPYKLGVTQTWDVQKANLEASFEAIATPLYFLDPFGVPPILDPTTGVYFWKFTETLLEWSTPSTPFIQYDLVLTQSPPGIIIQ
jgi:hypothetical protein